MVYTYILPMEGLMVLYTISCTLNTHNIYIYDIVLVYHINDSRVAASTKSGVKKHYILFIPRITIKINFSQENKILYSNDIVCCMY